MTELNNTAAETQVDETGPEYAAANAMKALLAEHFPNYDKTCVNDFGETPAKALIFAQFDIAKSTDVILEDISAGLAYMMATAAQHDAAAALDLICTAFAATIFKTELMTGQTFTLAIPDALTAAFKRLATCDCGNCDNGIIPVPADATQH